jgi:hypothetical protein
MGLLAQIRQLIVATHLRDHGENTNAGAADRVNVWLDEDTITETSLPTNTVNAVSNQATTKA